MYFTATKEGAKETCLLHMSVLHFIFQAEALLQATTSVIGLQPPNFSPTNRKASKRKMPAQNAGKPKTPRVFVADGKPPVPLDIRYLGLNRSVAEDREFKRGRFLEKLIEGTIKWDELNEHQHNCVFAKAALRGREENEIVCCLCYQLFTKAHDYKKHVRGHFGNFSCNMCEKECWSLDDLESHLATHLTFHCPLCNESYPSKPALTTHIRNDHQIFFKDNTAEESPDAKEVAKEYTDKPNDELVSRNNEVDTTSGKVQKPKPTKSQVKTPVASRRKTGKKEAHTKAVARKANVMQVTVVPQLIRTSSADSESEQTFVPKPITVPVTRSRGKLSATKTQELIPHQK